ncbi:MAG: hypothetical protein MHPSP_000221, partial [Paramarteilia canceri]
DLDAETREMFAQIPMTIGSSADVRHKNRYDDIIPYNYNRVILNSDASLYLNYSVLLNMDDEYFCTVGQGPTDKTINDFYLMIYEHNIKQVLMLCDFVEDSRPKCAQYFNKIGEDLECDNFLVEVVSNWPDKKIPDNLDSVLNILILFTVKNVCEDNMLVHCSAGVGRTGTFAMLYMVFNSLMKGVILIILFYYNTNEHPQ